MVGFARKALAVLVAALVVVGTVGVSPTGAAPRESENGSVSRLYQAYLLREPDAPGLAYWSEQYLSCSRSLAGISEFFASSPEFTARYGSLTNRQFVELIYQNVLGRPGEPSGVDYWTGQLDAGVARGLVMIGFTESAEYVTRTGTASPQAPLCISRGVSDSVYRLYRAYLLREPEADGERYWTQQYAQCNQTLTGISAFFASSPEFTARYGALTNQQFVELVYQNVLGRAGETSGVNYWVGEMNAGRSSRGQIMIGFSESAEYVAATGTTSPVGTGCAAPPTTTPPATTPPATTPPATTTPPSVYYANCAEVRAAGKAPLYSGQPGYRPGLDGDGDGVACES